jgi:hypothetical protein
MTQRFVSMGLSGCCTPHFVDVAFEFGRVTWTYPSAGAISQLRLLRHAKLPCLQCWPADSRRDTTAGHRDYSSVTVSGRQRNCCGKTRHTRLSGRFLCRRERQHPCLAGRINGDQQHGACVGTKRPHCSIATPRALDYDIVRSYLIRVFSPLRPCCTTVRY